jgi:hypothetical protein
MYIHWDFVSHHWQFIILDHQKSIKLNLNVTSILYTTGDLPCFNYQFTTVTIEEDTNLTSISKCPLYIGQCKSWGKRRKSQSYSESCGSIHHWWFTQECNLTQFYKAYISIQVYDIKGTFVAERSPTRTPDVYKHYTSRTGTPLTASQLRYMLGTLYHSLDMH